MNETVRVRYAPSPTGEPHIGNVRTALFNWLFARRHGGSFIVRIEDTDRERYEKDAVRVILEALRWLDLDWDEGPEVGGSHGPYFQSQRLETYHRAAKELVANGFAYYCYCSPERLKEMRSEQQSKGEPPGYDRQCRDLSLKPTSNLMGPIGTSTSAIITPEHAEPKAVVRFKMPLSGETSFNDMIRQDVSWQNKLLDDFVIIKSDSFPTYHLGNVVDDHAMNITHVLRAEEWLPSTPRHLQLYKALGYEPPLFGHFPLILGPDRSKLSKRHGATSILEYRDMGFLPEALINFMTLLGWSLDDHTDVMTRDTLVNNFSLDRVSKGGAIFAQEKLIWMNGVYIRQMSTEDLSLRMLPYLERDLHPSIPRPFDQAYLCQVIPLIQERVKRLDELAELTSYFFQEDLNWDIHTLIQKDMDTQSTCQALQQSLEVIESTKNFNATSLEENLRALASTLSLSGRQLFGTLRVAVTSRSISPPLFETMEVLGKERCKHRLNQSLRLLTNLGSS